MKIKILELFGGIGACTQALKRLGIDVEIADYVEIDKYAVASYNAINETNFEPQDIIQWDKEIEDLDLIMHGSPCQDFSLAGKQAGGDEGSGTRSSLMYETIRIVKKLKPKYVLWENVKNLLSQKHKHNFDAYIESMEQLGYINYYQVLNAKDYGIPQNRERVFTVSIRKDLVEKFNNAHSFSIRNNIKSIFEFPKKQELRLKLKDLLEDEVDEKYYIKKSLNIKGTKNYIQWSNSGKMQNSQAERAYYIQNDVMCTIPNCNTGGDKSQIVLDALSNEVEPSIKIKNATKLGYLEAYDGDSVNLAYPESETRRGRVGSQVSQTLQCNDSMGVIVKNKGEEIVKETDIACTLLARDYKGFGNQNMTGVIFDNSHNVVKDEPKVLGGIGEKKSNNGTQWYQQDRIYDNNVGISVTTTCNPFYPDNSLRIRKLTPKECWRLMGFSDECFEKASKVNSNAQLYKQAGNSIVVNVLYEIFKNLLMDNKKENLLDEKNMDQLQIRLDEI